MLVLAIVVCAWFALGIRQAREINEATNVITQSGTIPAPNLHSAASLLSSAGTLNPDLEVDVLRARLAVEQRDPKRAEQILKATVRKEPMNLEAWVWLAGVSLIDPPEAHIALAQIRRLDPRSS
jgi:hypothetical protein